MSEVTEYCKTNVVIILVGNKCDMEDQRVVSKEEIEKTANEFGVLYFETSAKKNINIDNFFQYLAKEILNRRNYVVPIDPPVNLNQKSGNKKKGLCLI